MGRMILADRVVVTACLRSTCFHRASAAGKTNPTGRVLMLRHSLQVAFVSFVQRMFAPGTASLEIPLTSSRSWQSINGQVQRFISF